jgi:hypothetical protein
MPGPNVPIAQSLWAKAEPLHGVRLFVFSYSGLNNFPAASGGIRKENGRPARRKLSRNIRDIELVVMAD